MKTNNLFLRTITCILGIPSVFGIIWFFPQHNFIGLSILTIVLSLLGSFEMSRMVLGKIQPVSFLGTFITIGTYIQCKLAPTVDYVLFLTVIFIVLVLAREIWAGANADDFKGSIERAGKNILVLLYPSFLFAYVVRMVALPYMTAYSILLFLILVFSNDIFAYVFGMLFGRKPKRGYVLKVSPKKSYAGFIGGTLSCISICFLWFRLFKENLPQGNWIFKLSLGLFVSVSANIGDLVESVFKRSAGVKDSGHLIPGRGGILDSTDSIMVAAPVFYILYSLI